VFYWFTKRVGEFKCYQVGELIHPMNSKYKFLQQQINLHRRRELSNQTMEANMISKCCGSPPLLNTDVHDGIAICDSCREWSGFYDEDEELGIDKDYIEARDPGDEHQEKKL